MADCYFHPCYDAFSVVECLKSWLGKLASKSVDDRYAKFSKPTFKAELTLCICVIQALFSLYFLLKGCLMVYSHGCGSTHAHFSKNNFKKSGMSGLKILQVV